VSFVVIDLRPTTNDETANARLQKPTARIPIRARFIPSPDLYCNTT
jgi:hypothetical protein